MLFWLGCVWGWLCWIQNYGSAFYLWYGDMCLELIKKSLQCAIRPEVTLNGWRNMKIQDLSNSLSKIWVILFVCLSVTVYVCPPLSLPLSFPVPICLPVCLSFSHTHCVSVSACLCLRLSVSPSGNKAHLNKVATTLTFLSNSVNLS